MNTKTNAMRLLEANDIPYKSHSYIDTKAISGLEVAEVLNENPNQLFKTLVTTDSQDFFVFLVPATKELQLKKAAKYAKVKSLDMVKSNLLFNLTGYVHGGCSPIGMKRDFKTYIDTSAKDFNTIFISAGKIGYQIEITLDDLREILDYSFGDFSN